MDTTSSAESIRKTVRETYGAVAKAVLANEATSCCGSGACCSGGAVSPIIIGNYTGADTAGLPPEAVLASLGCGNPTALAQLEAGQTVLDLGSGGGIDVLLSAQRVGPTGFVYGLDMTDEMLTLAEKNRVAAGAENVRFLKGEIESIPLPDESVDVIISNCVINLSADKPAVLREALRVLRPGGLFAVSDVVIRGTIDDEVRASMDAWAGCVAGALEEQTYLTELSAAGFVDASIEVTKEYGSPATLGCCSSNASDEAQSLIVSGFVRARKPSAVSANTASCAD